MMKGRVVVLAGADLRRAVDSLMALEGMSDDSTDG